MLVRFLVYEVNALCGVHGRNGLQRRQAMYECILLEKDIFSILTFSQKNVLFYSGRSSRQYITGLLAFLQLRWFPPASPRKSTYPVRITRRKLYATFIATSMPNDSRHLLNMYGTLCIVYWDGYGREGPDDPPM